MHQTWQRIQFSALRSRRYRAGLKNQMISRVEALEPVREELVQEVVQSA